MFKARISLQNINNRPNSDQILVDIFDYVVDHRIDSNLAYDTTRYCLMGTTGCGLGASSYPVCCKLLGSVVPGVLVPLGSLNSGALLQLDPVLAAFNYWRDDSLA